MRCLPAGDAALLVELAGLDDALALLYALQAQPPHGVRDIVPATRTLLIAFHPTETSAATLTAQVAQLHAVVSSQPRGPHDTATDDRPPMASRASAYARLVDIPVRYDGADLPLLAEQLGLTIAAIIEHHTGAEYLGAFAGFSPGFVYLAGVPAALHVPRRATPRTRVPAGSVAIAGAFSAVYPQDSPGGWTLLGTTACAMWDMQRAEPALIQPGFRVRFIDIDRSPAVISLPGDAARTRSDDLLPALATHTPSPDNVWLHCLSPGLQTLVQDAGRPGLAALGVSASGAMDRRAMRSANRVVGNPADTPVLENLLGQLRLRSAGHAVLAVTGAPAAIAVTTACGRTRPVCGYQPIALYEGDTLSIGPTQAGLRCYVAVRGGLDIAPVLGSRATDTLAHIGPAALRAGDALPVGAALAAGTLRPVALHESPPAPLPAAGDLVTLDLILGPRTDWFTPAALQTLLTQEWAVTPQSDRIGIRLSGAQPLARRHDRELPSEGIVVGALQVPPNGQPVLFMADRPLTGGYPVIGVVVSRHLDLAAQLPVGARLRFRAAQPF